MPEREWYEFEDPDKSGVTWRVDVTFLRSRWRCLFGDGCLGVLPEPAGDAGCCNHGAWFSGAEDHDRVLAAAQRLRTSQWANQRELARGIGRKKTRVVRGVCIFHNAPGFPGGHGCALHLGALGTGERPIEWKPDVCWQLPLRFRTDDDGAYVIEEFARRTWGEGGKDFHWWCTESADAFTARQPVYKSLEEELREMMGSMAYDHLAAYMVKTTRRTTAVVHLGGRRARAARER